MTNYRQLMLEEPFVKEPPSNYLPTPVTQKQPKSGLETILQNPVIEKIVTAFSQVNVPYSLGLTGSQAMGIARPDSDWDLWLCINREQVYSFFNDPNVQTFFSGNKKKSFYEEPIGKLRNRELDVMNVKAYIDGKKCSFDIYTKHSFSDITNLRSYRIRRWREGGASEKVFSFRNVHGEFADADNRTKGLYSDVKNVVIRNGLYHFGQHINRIYSSKIIKDEVGTLDQILIAWIKVLIHAKQAGATDSFSFLNRVNRFSPELKGKLSQSLNHLWEDIEKCRTSLKSTVMIT